MPRAVFLFGSIVFLGCSFLLAPSTLSAQPIGCYQTLAYVVANSEALELRSEGPGQQFVALHAAV